MSPFKFIPLPVIYIFFCLLSCKKDNVKIDQLLLLPPPTQTGANTLGCLVNGQAFVPRKTSIFVTSAISAQYLSGYKGNSFLTIAATHKYDNGSVAVVSISTDSLSANNGDTIALSKFAPGMATGLYGFNTTEYTTTAYVTGQVNITFMDASKHIMAGTFYYNAVNTAGDMVKVTDGRFDVIYK